MKAVQITSYDGPLGTLEYGETSDPTPAAGQIAINVHYAGASYVEALFAGGFVPTIPVPGCRGLRHPARFEPMAKGSWSTTALRLALLLPPLRSLTAEGTGRSRSLTLTWSPQYQRG